MLHPFISTLIRRPDLVLDHIAGYTSLAREETGALAGRALWRVVAWGVVFITGLVAVMLAGTAAMLGAIQDSFHWALVAVPAIPLAIALAALGVALRPLPTNGLAHIKEQLQADFDVLTGGHDRREATQ